MTLQLYLHFPFCKSKCLYCDFCSAPGSRAEMERYTAALRREIVQAGREYPNAEISTVYLGGGTPSILPPDLMASVLESLHIAFSFQPNVEFSSRSQSGNPDS
ncbi:MAG: radical SAM protein [Lachnospiraceae bacterium]